MGSGHGMGRERTGSRHLFNPLHVHLTACSEPALLQCMVSADVASALVFDAVTKFRNDK